MAAVVKNRLAKMFRGMIYVLPGVLFFSYYPLIHFGASESMNFEISLPLIWLVLFDVLVVVMMGKRKMLLKGWRRKWVWLLLPVFLTASVLWSLNPLRGLLTVGILWLLYLAADGFWSLRRLFNEVGFREKFWKVFFGSALVVCGWCWVQCVLDLVGVSREYSLMCAGCTYQMFGFPHPNGFAIEPQFMGNLLIAPAIISGWMLIRKQNSNNLLLLFCFFIISVTLFLTMSRGAIYAFVVGMIAMTVIMIVRAGKERGVVVKRVGVTWASVVLAFGLTLCVQGAMAAASPTNDTFQSGVAKALNHLSLGVVDVRENELSAEVRVDETAEESVEGEVTASEPVGEGAMVEKQEKTEAAFDGYVAESTDTRLRLSGAAVEVWSSDFKTAMFGVGLGGAGQALYVNGLSPAPKEIIQNQYVSLLLEAGLVGIALLVLTLVLVVRVVWRSPLKVVLMSLIIAYMISLCFFSGLPNALQIYLLPAVIYAIGLRKKLVS